MLRLSSFLALLLSSSLFGQAPNSLVISDDIGRFWTAYDSITTTTDSTEQVAYLEQYFLGKATPGLRSFMEARRYDVGSYIEAINAYPRFWSSVRENTLKSSVYAEEIIAGVAKLKALYPELKPAEIYFTIGALMSGGTTLDDRVLIGAEIAMADENTVSSEFPEWFQESLRNYFASNPINELTFLNVHEYVHTQQSAAGGYDLLSQCLYEGVAEFVAEKALDKASLAPCIAYGKANDDKLKARFEMQLFSPNYDEWLYNNTDNPFNMRDLGYYVGHAICAKYYAASPDKIKAIKELIELNYADSSSIELFVEKTGYFTKPMSVLHSELEQARPHVVKVVEFANGAMDVDPTITHMTIEFSEAMDPKFRSFDYGPLGEENVLRVTEFIGLSEDGRTVDLAIELHPEKELQLLVAPGFRNLNGQHLVPYLIDIRTRP